MTPSTLNRKLFWIPKEQVVSLEAAELPESFYFNILFALRVFVCDSASHCLTLTPTNAAVVKSWSVVPLDKSLRKDSHKTSMPYITGSIITSMVNSQRPPFHRDLPVGTMILDKSRNGSLS